MTDNGGGAPGNRASDADGDSWFKPSENRYRSQSEYQDPLEEDAAANPGEDGAVFPDSGGYAGLSASRPAMVEPYPDALGGPPSAPGISYPGAGTSAYEPVTRFPGEDPLAQREPEAPATGGYPGIAASAEVPLPPEEPAREAGEPASQGPYRDSWAGRGQDSGSDRDPLTPQAPPSAGWGSEGSSDSAPWSPQGASDQDPYSRPGQEPGSALGGPLDSGMPHASASGAGDPWGSEGSSDSAPWSPQGGPGSSDSGREPWDPEIPGHPRVPGGTRDSWASDDPAFTADPRTSQDSFSASGREAWDPEAPASGSAMGGSPDSGTHTSASGADPFSGPGREPWDPEAPVPGAVPGGPDSGPGRDSWGSEGSSDSAPWSPQGGPGSSDSGREPWDPAGPVSGSAPGGSSDSGTDRDPWSPEGADPWSPRATASGADPFPGSGPESWDPEDSGRSRVPGGTRDSWSSDDPAHTSDPRSSQDPLSGSGREAWDPEAPLSGSALGGSPDSGTPYGSASGPDPFSASSREPWDPEAPVTGSAVGGSPDSGRDSWSPEGADSRIPFAPRDSDTEWSAQGAGAFGDSWSSRDSAAADSFSGSVSEPWDPEAPASGSTGSPDSRGPHASGTADSWGSESSSDPAPWSPLSSDSSASDSGADPFPGSAGQPWNPEAPASGSALGGSPDSWSPHASASGADGDAWASRESASGSEPLSGPGSEPWSPEGSDPLGSAPASGWGHRSSDDSGLASDARREPWGSDGPGEDPLMPQASGPGQEPWGTRDSALDRDPRQGSASDARDPLDPETPWSASGPGEELWKSDREQSGEWSGTGGLDSWSPSEDTGDTWKGSGTTEPWAEQTERPWSDHHTPSYGGDRYDDELSPRPAEERGDRYDDELSPAPEQGGSGNTWAFDRNDPRLPDVVRDAERRRRESPQEPAYADWGSEDAPAEPDTGTLSAAVPGSDDPLAAIADMQSRARSKDPLDDEDDRPWDDAEDQRWDEAPAEGDDSWRGGEGATQMFTAPSFDSEPDTGRREEYEDERDDRAESDYEDDFTPADYGMPERPKQAKRRRDKIAEDFPGFDEARDDGDYPGYDSIDFLADTEPGANVTMWLGIASLVPFVGVITAILALFVTGPKAKRAIRESRGTLDGLGLITTGTVFAVIGVLVTVISLVMWFVL